MNGTRGRSLSHLLVALLTLMFAALCAAFVWQPTLATFADDSVSYLVMAQVFSPYQPASPAVAAAFPGEASYPPLFPAILALGGAAHHVAWAHAVTALLLAASIPLIYLMGTRWLVDWRMAALAVFCVVLLPSMWINAKGILSEPLFGALLAATFCVLDGDKNGRGRGWTLAILLAAMVLTRTVALVMVAAYALWILTRRAEAPASKAQALLPALVALAAYAGWVLLRPAAIADSYARILLEQGNAMLAAQSPLAAFGASVAKQVNAVAEGWIGSMLLYWVDGRPVRTVLAGLVGGLALAGMALRVAAGKADAWMVAAYLAVILVWPFYDQMGRFLFPILPVLILYAFLAAGTAMRALDRPQALGAGVFALLLLSLTLPAMAFIHQRAQAPGHHAQIVDWYRTPGLAEARSRAQVQLDLFADMEAINKLTRAADRVMWVTPSYLALLADRTGVAAPQAGLAPAAYRQAVRESGADYVFLSRYHPRDTIRTAAWQAGTRALAENAQVLHLRTQDNGSVVTSMLMKVDR